MSITSIPIQSETAGQLGQSKTDGTGVYDATTKIKAAQWNQVVLRLISAFNEIGLSDGSTVGSLRAAINAVVAGGIDMAAALLANVADLDFNDVDLSGIDHLVATELHTTGDATLDGSTYIGGDLTLVGDVNSLTVKRVRVATTANGTLATAFANGQTVDGKTLSTGDRILLKNQTDPTENGIRVVASSGAPARSSDCNEAADCIHGLAVIVVAGTVNAGHLFVCTSTAPTPGVTGLVFTDNGPFPGFGTSSTTACVGNDSRLSDSRAASSVSTGVLATTLASGTVAVTGNVGLDVTGNMTLGTATVTPVVIQGTTIQLNSDNDIDVTNAILYNVHDPASGSDAATFNTTKVLETLAKTTAYTLLTTDARVITVDDTAGRVDLTLPNPTSKRCYLIQKIAGTTGGIRLVRHGAEKVMTVAASYDLPGATTAFSSTAPQAWMVYTDGTDWYVC